MNYISDNIKRLRLSRNLTQANVYEKAGLSRIAYLNIEKGKSVPGSTTLINIARTLDVSLNDLVQEPKKLKSLRYRINKVKTEKDQSRRITDEIKLAAWLNNYNFLENELDDRIDYKLRNFQASDPIQAANEVRSIINIDNDEPILDIATLLENSGIKVYLYKSMILNFGMSLNESDGGPVVAVNTDDKISIERQIFTAAHELGHLILHKDSYHEETIEENPGEEKQADSFASYFIMTDVLFKNKLKETQGKNWVDRVLHLKRFFKVGYKTVLKRLADDNYINSQRFNIYIEFAKDYKRLYKQDLKGHFEPDAISDSEPEALTKSDFMAERYNRLVYEAYYKDIITTSKAAAMLGISLEDMKALTESWRLMDEREE